MIWRHHLHSIVGQGRTHHRVKKGTSGFWCWAQGNPWENQFGWLNQVNKVTFVISFLVLSLLWDFDMLRSFNLLNVNTWASWLLLAIRVWRKGNGTQQVIRMKPPASDPMFVGQASRKRFKSAQTPVISSPKYPSHARPSPVSMPS